MRPVLDVVDPLLDGADPGVIARSFRRWRRQVLIEGGLTSVLPTNKDGHPVMDAARLEDTGYRSNEEALHDDVAEPTAVWHFAVGHGVFLYAQ